MLGVMNDFNRELARTAARPRDIEVERVFSERIAGTYKAVHYNEWANFGKKDFEPVVTAFKELLGWFGCYTCDSWLYVTPRVNSDSLRCACNAINLNLKTKPK